MATVPGKKRNNQLKAYAKKRARRPVTTFQESGSLKVKGTVERRVVRDHADVLQNIEFSFVAAARESREIDDAVIEQTLRHAIQSRPTEEPVVSGLLNSLQVIREQRTDISDDLWKDALRVVYTSVQRHSSCQAGCKDYLQFVAAYVV